MIKQAAAAPRPCRAKPQLPHPSPFPGALSGPAGFLFPQTASKIGCFGAFAEFIRMAAKLRPAGRQTTPPGRADELPARKSPETAQFFHRFAGKEIRPARTVSQGRAGDAAAAVWPGMDGLRRRPVLSENLYNEGG